MYIVLHAETRSQNCALWHYFSTSNHSLKLKQLQDIILRKLRVLGEQTVKISWLSRQRLPAIRALSVCQMSTRLHVEANSVRVTTPLAPCTGPYLYRIKGMLLGYQLHSRQSTYRSETLSRHKITEQRTASHDFRYQSQPNNAHVTLGAIRTVRTILHFICFGLYPSYIRNFFNLKNHHVSKDGSSCFLR